MIVDLGESKPQSFDKRTQRHNCISQMSEIYVGASYFMGREAA
jgi:hypothetical protein